MSSLSLAQPQPWGPQDVLFAPGTPGFAATVAQSLAGVGDASDTFENDVAATATTLSTFPSAADSIDHDVAAAVAYHEDLRHYDPGVPALYQQAISNVRNAQKAFESSLAVPAPPAAPGGAAAPGTTGTGGTGAKCTNPTCTSGPPYQGGGTGQTTTPTSHPGPGGSSIPGGGESTIGAPSR